MDHEQLKALYTRAQYLILKESLPLIVGEKNRALDTFLKSNDARKGAFITAANPYSQKLNEEENTYRNRLLEEACEGHWKYVPALATAHDGDSWEEESLFIFDISLKEALMLAGSFGQHAILYCELGGEVELIFIGAEMGKETNLKSALHKALKQDSQ